MKLECYHELFLAQVEVINEVGITIPNESLGQAVANNNDHEEAEQMALAIQFNCGTNLHHKEYL